MIGGEGVPHQRLNVVDRDFLQRRRDGLRAFERLAGVNVAEDLLGAHVARDGEPAPDVEGLGVLAVHVGLNADFIGRMGRPRRKRQYGSGGKPAKRQTRLADKVHWFPLHNPSFPSSRQFKFSQPQPARLLRPIKPRRRPLTRLRGRSARALPRHALSGCSRPQAFVGARFSKLTLPLTNAKGRPFSRSGPESAGDARAPAGRAQALVFPSVSFHGAAGAGARFRSAAIFYSTLRPRVT